MDSAEMIIRVRHLLDDPAPGAVSDAEIMNALTSGQNEIALMLLSAGRHSSLRSLMKRFECTSLDLPEAPLPDDCLKLLCVAFASGSQEAHRRRYRIIRSATKAENSNKLLPPENYCQIIGNTIIFEGDFTPPGSCHGIYLMIPGSVPKGEAAVIPLEWYDAAVQYAFAMLLRIYGEQGEALPQYQLWQEMVRRLP